MFTEIEAKAKRCHKTLMHSIGDDDVVLPADGSFCIASECMAWRQRAVYRTLPSTESPGHASDGWKTAPSSMQSSEEFRVWLNDRGGYCGLAGSQG